MFTRAKSLITWHHHVDVVKSVVVIKSVFLPQSIIFVLLRLEIVALQPLVQISQIPFCGGLV